MDEPDLPDNMDLLQAGQGDDGLRQPVFIHALSGLITLSAAGLIYQPALLYAHFRDKRQSCKNSVKESDRLQYIP